MKKKIKSILIFFFSLINSIENIFFQSQENINEKSDQYYHFRHFRKSS